MTWISEGLRKGVSGVVGGVARVDCIAGLEEVRLCHFVGSFACGSCSVMGYPREAPCRVIRSCRCALGWVGGFRDGSRFRRCRGRVHVGDGINSVGCFCGIGGIGGSYSM